MRRTLGTFAFASVLAATVACNQPAPPAAPAAAAPAQAAPTQTPVERGKYLVTVGGCDDCHTPKVFKPTGPELDMTRRLSGHPADDKLPRVPAALVGPTPTQWGAVSNQHFTAWVGPWGTSFTRNLTPDKTTGLGSWTEEMFIKALKSGKDQGEGRPILPPMPWQNYAQMPDDDLKAIWAFLQTLPPIQNAIPQPIPPPGAPPAPTK